MSTPDPSPKHLHPRTVLLWGIGNLTSTALGVPALVAGMSGRSILWLALILLLAGSVALGIAWAKWRAFTYTLGAQELEIADGIFTRTRRSIPLERIQDVSIERKPLARLLGLALVRVETGGGGEDEGVLDSVTVAEAERLRAVLRHRAATAVDGEGAPVEAPAETTLFAMAPARVLHLGLYSFSLVWLAAIFGALQIFDDMFSLDWDRVVEWLGIARRNVEARASLAAAGVVLVLAVVVGVISGIAGALLKQWGFRVSYLPGRFRRLRGLLTRSEVVVAQGRIQLALVQRGIVSGRLGWASLRFQTLGGSDDVGGRQEMAPFARDAELAPLMDSAGLPRFDPLPLRPVAMGHVARAFVLRAGLPLVIVMGATLFAPLALLALILLPIPVATAVLARRHHRYAVVDGSLQVARGVLRKQEWVVPLDRVQAVSITRSWLQRLLGIATVVVGTAGAKGVARPNVVDLATEDAVALARLLLGAR